MTDTGSFQFGLFFMPHYWYWVASDGRIYASATQTIIASSDENYQQWLAAGKQPTPWPKDDSGNETTQALQDVVDAYGLTVPDTGAKSPASPAKTK